MRVGQWLLGSALTRIPKLNQDSFDKHPTRTRRMAIECLETRRVLAGTPFSTLQLLPSANAQLSEATTIRLDSYVFGIRNRIDVLGDGSLPQLAFDALTITANQQENPPLIFGQIAKAKSYAKAVLTQRDANGDAVSAWVLANVAVLSENVHSDGANTFEELSLSFKQITEASSQLVSSWDLVTNKPLGPSVPADLSLKPYASTNSSADLQLYISSLDATPAVVLKLDSFQFGVHNTLDDAINTITFDKLEVIAHMPSTSPALFKALTNGAPFDLAKLTQRDALGNVAGTWTMRSAAVVDEQLSASDHNLPLLDLDLDFGTLATATPTSVFQWNRVTGREETTGNAVAARSGSNARVASAAAAPAAPVVTGITLDLQGGTATAVSLYVESFAFGFHRPTTLQFGQFVPGNASFDSMDVRLTLPAEAPRLLSAQLNNKFYATATLSQRNQAGSVNNVWVLSNVLVSDNEFVGAGDGSTVQRLSFKFFSMSHAVGTDTVSFNQVTQRIDGPPLPVAPPVVALPSFSSGLSLNLFLGGSNVPTISLPVTSFSFGTRGAELLDTGDASGSTAFDPLEVSTVYQNVSPKLLTALIRSTQYARATISKTLVDKPVTLVTLGSVFVTDNLIDGSDNEVPRQTLRLFYGQVTESAGVVVKSWDMVTAKPSGPAPLPGLDLASLPTATGSMRLVLGRSAQAIPDVDVLIDSADFGFEKTTNRIQFDAIKISTALGAMSPVLFGQLVSRTPFVYGRVTQLDASGNVIATWQLSNVYLKSHSVVGDLDSLREEYEISYQAFEEQVGGVRNRWDRVLNRDGFSGARLASIANFASRSSSAAREVRSGAILELSGSSAPALSLPLDMFEFGYVHQTGQLLSPTTYLPLNISLALSPSSASLFAVMTSGSTYETATISKYENSALPTAAWVMKNVLIQSDRSQAAGDQTTKRLSFQFDSLASIASTVTELTASSQSIVYGQSTTLTATVRSGSTTVKSGTVTFSIGGQTLATVSVDADGRAVYVLDSLTVAGSPYTVEALYQPTGEFLASLSSVEIAVTPIELSTSGLTFTPTAGAPFNGVVASFTVPGNAIAVGSFVAQIAWGNGRTSGGIITQNGNTFVVNGKHTYGTNNSFNVRVSIRHTNNLTVPVTVTSLAYVTRLGFGQTQTAAYWSTKAGQTLIKSFNGSATRTELANWLADGFPNIYGAQAGINNLAGKTNTIVASLYLSLTSQQSRSLEQEVLATALSVYASTLSLGGTAGGRAGFQVTGSGLGTVVYNVGNRGAAFNAADNTSLSVLDILGRINSSTLEGALYNAAPEMRSTAEQLLEQINLGSRSGVLVDQVQPVDFWVSDRGVSLIKAFGGPTSRQLSSWLASTLRNLYGTNAGSNRLLGKTNTQIAAYLQGLNSDPTTQTAAQVLTTALNLYASTQSLGITAARAYGFNVTEYGLGAGYFNIDQSGIVAGVANRSTINVYALLQAIDRQSGQGLVLGGNATLSQLGQQLCRRINSGFA